jgi:glycosyltransferase involved in cell wall biosynthesis
VNLSVIIPVYNGAPYLAETLDSLFAQTHPADEIIVVDDGSTDSSPSILRSYGSRLSVVRQENCGVATARNVGLAHASGDLISFLDQDDLWPADRNRLLVEALRADPTADVAAGFVEIRYERPTPPHPRQNLDTMRREFLLGSLCMRACLIQTLGPFNTNVGYGDDTDFWLRRVEAKTKTVYVDEVTLIYRLHSSNTSFDNSRSKFHLLSALRESLKRRRSKHENKLHNSHL